VRGVQLAHQAPLEPHHRFVLDMVAPPHPPQLRLELRVADDLALGVRCAESGHRLDVDVERIAEEPRDRAVWADVAVGVAQRMQRVHADELGADARRPAQQAGEVGEVTDSPVARTAQRVEVRRYPEHLAPLQQLLRRQAR
jgi:hypothetical protein